MSTLKVGTIQDHANSNTAISIDSTGVVSEPRLNHTTKVYVTINNSNATIPDGNDTAWSVDDTLGMKDLMLVDVLITVYSLHQLLVFIIFIFKSMQIHLLIHLYYLASMEHCDYRIIWNKHLVTNANIP